MTRYGLLVALVMVVAGCGDVTTDSSNNSNSNNNNSNNINNVITNNGDGTIVEVIGPDHDADVQLADADLWSVPMLDIGASPEMVVWTLLHPPVSAHVYVRRFCAPQTPEPFLWLRESADNGGLVIAILPSCDQSNDVFATVELAFTETHWVGIAATGGATLVPPLP